MVVMADCFKAMLHRVKVTQVQAWLVELVRCGLVTTYVVNGKRYGEFTTWTKHQRVRAATSKYPPPSSADIGGQPLPDAPVVGNRSRESRVQESDNGASAPTPPQIAFQIPESIQQALARSPILGAVARLREPAWWQAQVRANGRRGIDFAAELLKAEAWLTTNPHRAPRKDHARFLHTWLARAEGPHA